MTLLALQSHNYILHFLLLDANIYHDFNTRLQKTKRQDTVVKGFACFIFVSKPPDAGCLLTSCGGWLAGPALAAAELGHPARGGGRASPSTKLCAIRTREVLFPVVSDGVLPSSCFVAVSSNRVLTAQHKPWCQDSEPLVETRPAEEPFWWDEARLPIPSLTFSPAAPERSRHLLSGCSAEYLWGLPASGSAPRFTPWLSIRKPV